METYLLLKLRPQPITSENFAPFGQVIFASEDGKAYDASDAQLQLQNGIPRFYIMRLHHRGTKFDRITRHLRCTQCLGSLEGKEWLMAVARPDPDSPTPDWESIRAFRIPGNCFIKLHVGTWTRPYFEVPLIDFYNLELSDTNVVDHDTCNLLETYGVEIEITDDFPDM